MLEILKVNARPLPGEGRRENLPTISLSQYLWVLNERISFVYFWKSHGFEIYTTQDGGVLTGRGGGAIIAEKSLVKVKDLQ